MNTGRQVWTKAGEELAEGGTRQGGGECCDKKRKKWTS